MPLVLLMEQHCMLACAKGLPEYTRLLQAFRC